MAESPAVAQLLGADFSQAYLAVKALEHDHYLREISAWERRYLFPVTLTHEGETLEVGSFLVDRPLE